MTLSRCHTLGRQNWWQPMPPPDPAAWVEFLRSAAIPPFDPPPFRSDSAFDGTYPLADDRLADFTDRNRMRRDGESMQGPA